MVISPTRNDFDDAVDILLISNSLRDREDIFRTYFSDLVARIDASANRHVVP